jgi:hypothetical protein
MLLIFAVCASGCYTFNKNHNSAHNSTLKKDLKLLHEDVDSFLGTTEPSMLSE